MEGRKERGAPPEKSDVNQTSLGCDGNEDCTTLRKERGERERRCKILQRRHAKNKRVRQKKRK